jgi:hypothetical protein
VKTKVSITGAGISSMADVDCVRFPHFKAHIPQENAPASRLHPRVKNNAGINVH